MQSQDYVALAQATAGRPLSALGRAIADEMATLCHPYDITPPLRLAHFMAQVCEETDFFQTLVEYGGKLYFARYDGREDLGNTQPGDGARYRGRGALMITGRSNYVRLGKQIGLDLEAGPELAEDPHVAVLIACIFWEVHGLSDLADADDLEAVTRKINGGLNGLAERKAALDRAKAWLAAHPEPAPVAPIQPPPPAVAAPDDLDIPPPPAPPAVAAAPPPPTDDLPSLARTVIGSQIRHLIAGGGIGIGLLGSLSPSDLDKVVGLLTALVFFAGAGLWAWWKDHRHRRLLLAAREAAAPPQHVRVVLDQLSPDDVARIAAAVVATRQS